MFQTRTRVTTPDAQKQQREAGAAAALRAMAAVQLLAQLLLWITFFGYDRTQQTVWQAALLLCAAWLPLYWLWKGAGQSRWLPLALLPCLQLDACFALLALSGFIAQLIPQYPAWVGVIVPAAFCLLSALRAQVRGVAYGTALLRWVLVGLVLLSTVFLRASTRADRLWPLLGEGPAAMALAALGGAGSVWGTALIFALPQQHCPQRRLRWALAPWLLGCVWALWMGFVRPWAAGDALPVAEKMMGLARHAMSVVVYELSGMLWMLLLPLSLCGCAAATEQLVLRALPRLPRWIPLLFSLLPACAVLLWRPDAALRSLEALLPWRAAVALLCGAAMRLMRRKEAA